MSVVNINNIWTPDSSSTDLSSPQPGQVGGGHLLRVLGQLFIHSIFLLQLADQTLVKSNTYYNIYNIGNRDLVVYRHKL